MKFGYVSFAETKDFVQRHPQLGDYSPLILSGMESNPHITDDFPILCYMRDGDRIVSHFSSFPDRVYHREREYDWAWCGNLFTDPEYRGKGLASALVREQAALFHSKNLAWGGVFSTPTALQIYQRLGFSVRGYAPRYLIIKSIAPFLKHHLSNSMLVGAADLAYGALVHAARRLLHDDRGFARRYVIGASNSADDFEGVTYSEPFHFDDSKAMTSWRMGARNVDQFLVARSRDTGRKAFYVIVRNRDMHKKALLGRYKGFRLMTVMDYGRFDPDPSTPDAIVSGALSLFLASDADACEIVSSDEGVCRAARRRGMLRVGMGMSFAYSLPAAWDFGSEQNDMHRWHLTHYRGDAFAFE